MTMFQLSKRFFSLPQEVKAKIAWDKSNRGWVAFQREALDPVTNPTGDPKGKQMSHIQSLMVTVNEISFVSFILV
jgi:isopenicillin N synthase-like dioxygenase